MEITIKTTIKNRDFCKFLATMLFGLKIICFSKKLIRKKFKQLLCNAKISQNIILRRQSFCTFVKYTKSRRIKHDWPFKSFRKLFGNVSQSSVKERYPKTFPQSQTQKTCLDNGSKSWFETLTFRMESIIEE